MVMKHGNVAFSPALFISLIASILVTFRGPVQAQPTPSPLAVVSGRQVSEQDVAALVGGFYELTLSAASRGARSDASGKAACAEAFFKVLNDRSQGEPSSIETNLRCALATTIQSILNSGTAGPFWSAIYKETPPDPQSQAELALSVADAVVASQEFSATPFARIAPALEQTVVVTPTRPGCLPDRAATTLNKVIPYMPEEARKAHAGGVVVAEVQIDAAGNARSVTVYYSASHNKALDDTTISAARESKYGPAIRNCVPISSTYLYAIRFESM